MDAELLASLPPKLLAQYLRDPTLMQAQEMSKKGSDTSPIKGGIVEGLSRMGQGALAGFQQHRLTEDYNAKANAVKAERLRAMEAAKGGDYMGALSTLESPDNEGLGNTFLGAKINADQQEKLFGQQRQLAEMQLARQQAMQDALLKRQMEFENFKNENDPQRQFMRQLMQQYGLTAPQAAPSVNVSGVQTMPDTSAIPPIPASALQPNAPLPPAGSVPMPAAPQPAPALPQTAAPQPAPQVPQQGADGLLTYMATGKLPDGMAFGKTPDGRLGVVPMMTHKEITDQKNMQQGKQRLTNSIQSMVNDYGKLNTLGGIVNNDKPWWSNAVARYANSEEGPMWGILPSGQGLGGTFGTKEQTLRDNITSVRSLLLPQIMQATGISAKQLDSNTELQTYLKALADPKMSFQSVNDILTKVNDLFGLQGQIKFTDGQQQPNTGGIKFLGFE